MFRIDKSDVDNLSMNKSYVVIRHKDSPIEHINNSNQIEPDEVLEESEQESRQNAVEKAKMILQNVERQAEQIKQAAWKEGFEQGRQEAEQKSTLIIQSQVKTVLDFLNRLKVYKQNLFNEMENSVLQLSMEVAEKIINTELKKDDKVYVGIVKKAVSKLNTTEPFVLRVSNSDYDLYFKDSTQWLQNETEQRLLEVICDPHMQQGDLIIESEHAVVGAGVSLQINKVKRLLCEEIEHGLAG